MFKLAFFPHEGCDCGPEYLRTIRNSMCEVK
jgi:hypothetical protein